VDLKETPGGPVVIEVNDNPNLDTGYDDVADGDRIYEDILAYFLERIETLAPGAGTGSESGVGRRAARHGLPAQPIRRRATPSGSGRPAART
jgi:hypothetical protein